MENDESEYTKIKEDAENIKDFILFRKEDFTFTELRGLIKENLGIDDVYFIMEQLSELRSRREVFAYGDYYSSTLMNPLPPIRPELYGYDYDEDCEMDE